MKTIITDGGRSTSSHPNETRDCTVRALACAASIGYDEAHEYMANRGRRYRRGFHSYCAFRAQSGSSAMARKGSVDKFIRTNPIGRYVIAIRHHAFALVDGIIYDDHEVSPNCHVKRAWRIA